MNRSQALASLQAYLPEDKEIIKIINLCQLDPINTSNNGWRGWRNSLPPYLKIQKDKKIVVKWKEEYPLAPQKDLYAYADTIKIATISKSLMLLNDQDYWGFVFWGQDNILRYRGYLNQVYLNQPPLSVPFGELRSFVKLENIERYKKIRLSKKSESSGWITKYPFSLNFYQEIQKETNVCKNINVNKLLADLLIK